MSFISSNAVGKYGEELVAKIFENIGYTVVSNNEATKKYDYDLIATLGKIKITIECKCDRLAVKTGNLALEYRNDKKDAPSGITATKAKIWAHIIYDNGLPTVWIANVKNLLKYVEVNKPFKTIANGGDGNAALYLYRLDDILPDIFKRLDNLPTENVSKVINSVLKGK